MIERFDRENRQNELNGKKRRLEIEPETALELEKDYRETVKDYIRPMKLSYGD